MKFFEGALTPADYWAMTPRELAAAVAFMKQYQEAQKVKAQR